MGTSLCDVFLKKLFEALQIINFFCYYFNTLKAANKIPLLNRKVFDTLARCPPLFPHLPLRGFYSQKIAIHPKEILNEEQKSTVGEAIKTAITEEQKQKVIETIAEAIRNHTMRAAIFPLSDKQKEISTYRPRATAIFNSYKMSYTGVNSKIGDKSLDPISSELGKVFAKRIRDKFRAIGAPVPDF